MKISLFYLVLLISISSISIRHFVIFADSSFVYCYGIKNSSEPLNNNTVKGAWAIDPSKIEVGNKLVSKYSSGAYLKVEGTWANPSYLSGTYGESGWMNYFRLAQDITIEKQIINGCKAAFSNLDLIDNNTHKPLNGAKYGDYIRNPFKDLTNLRILPVISNGTYQYPMVNYSTTLNLFHENMKGIIDSTNVNIIQTTNNYFNYNNIHILSLASALAYTIPKMKSIDNLNEFLQMPSKSDKIDYSALKTNGFSPFIIMKPKDGVIPNNLYNYALALKNDNQKIIFIAYKGTDSSSITNDSFANAGISLMNLINTPAINNYISSAYQFYEKIKQRYPDYKIILTGHSLGGYLSVQVAVRTGELARVFSSPSNFLTAKKMDITASIASLGYLPLPNVMNFARNKDYLINLTQNVLRNTPINATFYFPERSGDINFTNNHWLKYFVTDITSKYAIAYSLDPSHYQDIKKLYLYADTIPDYIMDKNIIFVGNPEK